MSFKKPLSYAGVRGWPSFLLRRIPGDLRARIEIEAEESGESLAEVIRTILCAHYGLNCDRVETLSGPPAPAPATATMVLRLQPELFRAIQRDARESGESMRTLIVAALEDHYEEER